MTNNDLVDVTFGYVKYKQAFYENKSDWRIFLMFGNNRPMDIDGFDCRNANIIIYEEKEYGAPISTGQQRTFDELMCLPNVTVIYLYYDKIYKYDTDGEHIMNEDGTRQFAKEYRKMVIHVYELEPYTTVSDVVIKANQWRANWLTWSSNNPYMTKQQQINRLTNGLSQEDIDALFANVTKRYTNIKSNEYPE